MLFFCVCYSTKCIQGSCLYSGQHLKVDQNLSSKLPKTKMRSCLRMNFFDPLQMLTTVYTVHKVSLMNEGCASKPVEMLSHRAWYQGRLVITTMILDLISCGPCRSGPWDQCELYMCGRGPCAYGLNTKPQFVFISLICVTASRWAVKSLYWKCGLKIIYVQIEVYSGYTQPHYARKREVFVATVHILALGSILATNTGLLLCLCQCRYIWVIKKHGE